MNGSEYIKAINLFESLGDYSDSRDLINQTKYNYVINHRNSNDTITYEYLKELKDLDYKDAASVFHDVYDWNVRFLCLNTSENDETTNVSSVSKYDTFYTHFKLTGGEPGSETDWSWSIYWPDGTSTSGTSDSALLSNGTLYVYGWYYNPENGATGTCTVVIYIDDEEKCSTSFILTN